jgi:hypothetical protein
MVRVHSAGLEWTNIGLMIRFQRQENPYLFKRFVRLKHSLYLYGKWILPSTIHPGILYGGGIERGCDFELHIEPKK